MLLLGGARKLLAASSAVASTEHFYYRLGPAWPYIDSQRDNKAFGYGDGVGAPLFPDPETHGWFSHGSRHSPEVCEAVLDPGDFA